MNSNVEYFNLQTVASVHALTTS